MMDEGKVFRVDQFKPTFFLTDPEKKLIYCFRNRMSLGEIHTYVEEKLKEEHLGFYERVDYENIQRHFEKYLYLLQENGFIH